MRASAVDLLWLMLLVSCACRQPAVTAERHNCDSWDDRFSDSLHELRTGTSGVGSGLTNSASGALCSIVANPDAADSNAKLRAILPEAVSAIRIEWFSSDSGDVHFVWIVDTGHEIQGHSNLQGKSISWLLDRADWNVSLRSLPNITRTATRIGMERGVADGTYYFVSAFSDGRPVQYIWYGSGPATSKRYARQQGQTDGSAEQELIREALSLAREAAQSVVK